MNKDDNWDVALTWNWRSEASSRRQVCGHVERLLRLGFSLSTGSRRFDVWNVASFKDNARLSKLLVRYGPPVCDNPAPDALPPPLYIAIRKGSRRCFKMLLAAGADANEGHERSPIAAAMLMDDLAVYRDLVRAGASPMGQSGETIKPLWTDLGRLREYAG